MDGRSQARTEPVHPLGARKVPWADFELASGSGCASVTAGPTDPHMDPAEALMQLHRAHGPLQILAAVLIFTAPPAFSEVIQVCGGKFVREVASPAPRIARRV